MMSSCCTLRLKRRKAFSKDSDSWMMTSATLNSPPIRFGLVTCGVVVYGAPPMSIIACNRRHVHEHVDRIMGHLVVNSGIRCQVILVKRAPREFGKWRAIGARYTYCVVVTISKVLDLVGIPSILWVGGGLPARIARMLLVTSQTTGNFKERFQVPTGGSPKGRSCIQTCAASYEFGAGGHWGDEGIALRIRCVVRMSRVNVW
jgi:hypothetical protein